MFFRAKKTSPLSSFGYTKGVRSLVSVRVFGVGGGRPQVELGLRYALDSSSPGLSPRESLVQVGTSSRGQIPGPRCLMSSMPPTPNPYTSAGRQSASETAELQGCPLSGPTHSRS